MSMTLLELKLPDSLAREAKAAGLLPPQAIERLLREEMRRRVNPLVEAADRLAALDLPPLTEAKVETEIQAVRVVHVKNMMHVKNLDNVPYSVL